MSSLGNRLRPRGLAAGTTAALALALGTGLLFLREEEQFEQDQFLGLFSTGGSRQ